ncbi:MAG: amidohydrolase family protein [Acidobacteriota bacterium]|nr:amidohydrolase family protein [Acidobacteriota bacterium]
METPWGPLEVSDAHVHFFSRRFFETLGPIETVQSALGWDLPETDPAHLAETWVREMDRIGVRMACIIASTPGDEDSVIGAARLYPDRFRAYAMVNPTDPDSAKNVEAALATGLLRGLCFFPAMHRYSIQDQRAAALLDLAAAKAGTVAFVHCGVLSVGVRRKLGLPSPFDMRFSNPIDMHAVALRYPRLPFVVPHFGAGYFREALMLCDLCPNVFLDTSSSNSWMRYEDAHDLRTVFKRALEVCGPKRLLFGSDSSFFPRGWNATVLEAQMTALYEIGVNADVARAVLHENLHHLLP